MVRFFLFLIMIVSAPATAAASLPGPYEAEILRVVDGDSFEARIRIWVDQDVTVIVRLAGIDAAERRAPCWRARVMSGLAMAALSARLKPGGVRLSEVKRDKYGGRVVARVTDAGGADVATALMATGLVRPYEGRRPDWCGPFGAGGERGGT